VGIYVMKRHLDLKLKTRPKQRPGSLLFDIELPMPNVQNYIAK